MFRTVFAASIVVSLATVAPAAVVSLNFEGINPVYPSPDTASVLDFYNGGTSSAGTTGTNYGVSFGVNALALCLNPIGGDCSNTSRGGQGDPASGQGGLFFLDGDETFLNYAAGFVDGFSFNYASISFDGNVEVYDGLNGTGNLLGTVALTAQSIGCPAYAADFCPFVAAGITFAGTARSISFGGVANQIVFDDITFGSVTPGTPQVPEPAGWAMMLVGFGAIGTAIRRGRRVHAVPAIG